MLYTLILITCCSLIGRDYAQTLDRFKNESECLHAQKQESQALADRHSHNIAYCKQEQK